jgi:hypothetical protein
MKYTCGDLIKLFLKNIPKNNCYIVICIILLNRYLCYFTSIMNRIIMLKNRKNNKYLINLYDRVIYSKMYLK